MTALQILSLHSPWVQMLIHLISFTLGFAVVCLGVAFVVHSAWLALRLVWWALH